jgi:periplasmic divalent cation tolerance protein
MYEERETFSLTPKALQRGRIGLSESTREVLQIKGLARDVFGQLLNGQPLGRKYIMAEYIEVHTTIDSLEGAQKIANAIVSRRLAACVQVSGPITSTYWWQGNMEQAEEWVCTAKARGELYSRLEQAIREVHPYDVPEILAVSVVAGNTDYLTWVSQETSA